jgi:hypothetical protein
MREFGGSLAQQSGDVRIIKSEDYENLEALLEALPRLATPEKLEVVKVPRIRRGVALCLFALMAGAAHAYNWGPRGFGNLGKRCLATAGVGAAREFGRWEPLGLGQTSNEGLASQCAYGLGTKGTSATLRVWHGQPARVMAAQVTS